MKRMGLIMTSVQCDLAKRRITLLSPLAANGLLRPLLHLSNTRFQGSLNTHESATKRTYDQFNRFCTSQLCD